MSAQQATWNPNVRLQLRDAHTGVTPRDHQLAAWDRLTAHFIDGEKKAGLVVVPTGGGKTVLAAQWLLQNHIRNGGRVLWLAHRRGLLRQAFATFHRLANLAFPRERLHMIAISSDGERWSSVTPEHDVVFSSMQTAVMESNTGFVHELHAASKSGLFVVVDEAHHAPAPGYARLLLMLKNLGCSLLGLTATPVRADEDDEKRLIALFDSQVIYQVTRRELTDRGILAAPVFETVKTEVNFEKDFTEEDYKHLERFGELGPQVLHRLAKNASRNALIVEQYLQKRTVYGSTIVFAADTLHAHTLAEEFQKKGVDADYVDYGRKDAQQIIERYQRDKKPDVLVNVEMLTEGFDAPHTKTVFIVRPTRSEGLLAQMVGRALRGKQSNGNEYAYLVTFLDTWQQFNVLDAEYVLHEAQYAEPLVPEPQERPLFTIPLELVQEAYRLLQSNIRGLLVGVYQCVPSGWFTWEEAFENDQQRRSVMVFDNQLVGFDALLSAYSAVSTIPAEIDQELALDLIRKYFADVPDPLPRWADVKALLDAKRKGSEIHRYTFQEKAEFDPANIAKTIVSGNMTMLQEQDHIQGIWTAKAACRLVYRDDLQAFLEDIGREKIAIVTPARQPALPEVEAIVPKDPPRAWASGDRGWSLSSIRDAVVSVKRHFPNGPPMVRDLKWTRHPNSSLWGFFRYADKSVTINCILNSPDVPLFALEFLMFHEILHADLPSAGHNREFRIRERGYTPSSEALADAANREIQPGPNSTSDFWRVRADMFFDTFNRYYSYKRTGTTMGL